MVQLLQFAIVSIAILLAILQSRKIGLKKSGFVILSILFSAFIATYLVQYDAFHTIPPDASRLLTYYKKLLLVFVWTIIFFFIESIILYCMKNKGRMRMNGKAIAYFCLFFANLFAVLTANANSLFGIYSIYIYKLSLSVIVIAGVSYYFTRNGSQIESEDTL